MSFFSKFGMKWDKEYIRRYMMFSIHLRKNLSFVDPFRLQMSASLFNDHKSFTKNMYIKNKILGESRG